MDNNKSSTLAWALGLWGVTSVVIGSLIFVWPGITLKVMLLLIGINFIISGAVLTVGSLVDRKGHWVGGILMGVLSLIAGLYVFANPGISGLVLVYILAAWSIAIGALQITSGFESKQDKGWLIFSGILSIIFGIFIFGRPLSGALAIIWVIGLFTVVQGVMLIIAAFKAHSLQELATANKR